MPAPPLPARRLLLVDDDLLTREVLTLLAMEAGFDVEACDSGEAALEAVAASSIQPDAILADMQMSGVSGDTLARLLRAACPDATLLAMSGSAVPAAETASFDGFLLKPFSIDHIFAALDRKSLAAPAPAPTGILSESIFNSFSKSMSRDQVRQLYAMSLDDADARIVTLRRAVAANDPDAYRRAAHSIKGGCGMVGALELARLAGHMEEDGPHPVDKPDPCDEFLLASAHLRRMLDAQLK